MTTSINAEYNVFAGMERTEIEGLTAFANMRKPSIPFRVKYDSILVDGFYTGMNTDPREEFADLTEYAEEVINYTIAGFKTIDSVSKNGRHSWQIQTGFVTIDLCLHCSTNYNCSENVFEDVAAHRVSVTMVAQYDTKHVYRSTSHSVEIFEGLNQFYYDLKMAMNEK